MTHGEWFPIVNRAGGRPMARPLPVNRRGSADAPTGDESWYRIRNAATRGGTAEIYIYDEIGYWGVSAQQLVDDLRELDAATIDLHINSPGGEVYDGIAIYNALLAHPAQVNVTVDALAASAASFIAQAGHTVTMAANSEMMIHDAIGLTWGNEDDHVEMAGQLGRVSDNIAAIYADRAGGTVAAWRKIMKAETWYSASEAVAAGLADKVIEVQRRGADGAVDNRWSSRRDAISARFRYASRGATVAPPTDARAVEQGWQFQGEPDPPVLLAQAEPVPEHPEPGWHLSPDTLRTALHVGLDDVGFVAPDTFHALLESAVTNAPAPPAGQAVNPLTRTVGYEGANLNDLLREAVTG